MTTQRRDSTRRTTPRIALMAFLAVLTLGIAACQPLPGPGAGGASSNCSDMKWGSKAKVASRMSPSPIHRVRVQRHRCFDRMIIDLRSSPGAGWSARYTTVTSPGAGNTVALRGSASIEIVAQAPAYDNKGKATFNPANPKELANLAGFDVFRQIAFAGSFEGQTTFGIGVRSRLPFRVWSEDGSSGTKIVIDVGRRWP